MAVIQLLVTLYVEEEVMADTLAGFSSVCIHNFLSEVELSFNKTPNFIVRFHQQKYV